MYVYLSVENIMSNIRAIMVYVFFVLDLSSIDKFIKFDKCKGHLNKALIDKKKHAIFTVYLELVELEDFFYILVKS